ncbi:TPA: hypothetical protein L5C29_003225 [Pseudomonas aeruginosa]|nr:hypothetical protein [Pseudomonas aeruginosa]
MRLLALLTTAVLITGCSDVGDTVSLPEGSGAWVITSEEALGSEGSVTLFTRFDDGKTSHLVADFISEPVGMGGRFITIKAPCGEMRFLESLGKLTYWTESRTKFLAGARQCGLGGRTHYAGWKLITGA